jgi:hypothetical protein
MSHAMLQDEVEKKRKLSWTSINPRATEQSNHPVILGK